MKSHLQVHFSLWNSEYWHFDFDYWLRL